jgi:hypothetical protein
MHDHEDHTAGDRADHGSAVTESVCHVHIVFFGLPLTLPSSDRTGSDRHNDGPVIVSILAASPAVVVPNGLVLKAVSRPLCQLSFELCDANRAATFCTFLSVRMGSPLLCDTARLERSGVQRI